MPAKLKKVEYKNVTDGETMFITVGRTDLRDGKATKVLPGKSVFLNPDDIDFYKEDVRFVKGRIRKATIDTLLSGNIEVRDDMSEIEIQVFVERVTSAKSLGNKMKSLTSITTVSGILDQCKKQDKPYSLIETCLRKVNSLSDRMEIDIKNMKKDAK
jgi:hypothetical protein